MDDSRKLDRTWLCSIVFSDIVNYSSQSVELQMKWKRFFNEVLAQTLASVPVDDRIVLDTGDGAAICFMGEPEVALLSTLSMRCAFVDRVAADSSSPRIRLGINLGSVKMVRDINGNLNALGDGINVAQRVMSFAAPNQVLVSQSYFEVVSRLSDDYKALFRYDSVRKDKHVREHVVYELSPSNSGSSPVATHTVVEEASAKMADPPPVASRRTLFLLGGLSAVLLVALAAVLLFRPKPRVEAQNPANAPQTQPSSRSAASPEINAPIQSKTGAKFAPPARDTPSVAPKREGAAAIVPPSAASSKLPEPPAVAPPVADLSGRWQADVKYSWGDSHPEVLNIKVDQGEVIGTASYVRTPRAILDGKLDGTKLTFLTKSQTMLGDKTYEEKHFYRGRVVGDTIEFVLQTESGYDSRPPEMFTARKVRAPGAP